eukprot:scaffold363_cov331-Pavlova_lutheri.AAC.112
MRRGGSSDGEGHVTEISFFRWGWGGAIDVNTTGTEHGPPPVTRTKHPRSCAPEGERIDDRS